MEIVTTPAEYEYDDWMDPSWNFSGAVVDGADEGYDWDRIWRSIDIMSMVTLVIYGVVCVLGVSGNGVVIWATGFRMKKTVSTVWYLNLAVADFLVTALLPLEITRRALDYHWPFGRFVCKMDGLVFYVNIYASIFTLAVISADRCACVVHPVWARCSGHRTVRKASRVSVGVWVLALALSSPYFMFRDTQSYGGKVMCYDNYALVADYSNRTPEEYQLHKFRLVAMVITRFLLGIVVPFSVIVSCYSVVIYRLRNNRSLAGQSRRSFKIMSTVIAAFFLCWAPFHVMRLIYIGVTEFSDTMQIVHLFGLPITRALALVNSCLNPLLYVFMGQGFKDAFRCRSVLKVLEKAFAEEPPQTRQHTDPAVTRQMIAFEGSAGPHGTQDPSGEFPI